MILFAFILILSSILILVFSHSLDNEPIRLNIIYRLALLSVCLPMMVILWIILVIWHLPMIFRIEGRISTSCQQNNH
jgi:hypothetical protein